MTLEEYIKLILQHNLVSNINMLHSTLVGSSRTLIEFVLNVNEWLICSAWYIWKIFS